MKSFEQFFLEYTHKINDLSNIHTIHPTSGKVGKDGKLQGPGKGSNITLDPLSHNPMVGPYQKENDKLDIPGSILTFPELEEIGLKTLMDIQLPMMFQNVKNSGANVLVFRTKQGDIQGRVIKHSQPNK